VWILASPYPQKKCEDVERHDSRGGVTSVPRREFNQNPDDFHFLATICLEIIVNSKRKNINQKEN
jgi:hypothetical protein